MVLICNLQYIGYPKYFVTSQGKVYSLHYNMIKELKQFTDKDGYKIVNLAHKGQRVRAKVHRLIAQSFLNNPFNLESVDHIDSDKTNNNINNLQWLSLSANTSKSHNTRKSYASKSLLYYDGTKWVKYNSIKECSQKLNIAPSTIRRVLNGKIKNSKYKFRRAFK